MPISKGKVYITNARVIKNVPENSLLLDVDSKTFDNLEINNLLRILGIVPLYVRHDRTNRGWHIVICTRENFTPLEKIALQAILGSDSRREALNFRRYQRGVFLNLLFEPKGRK